MKSILQQHRSRTEAIQQTYEPKLFRTSCPADWKQLMALLEQEPNITVYDTLTGQLEELIKTRCPKEKLAPADVHMERGLPSLSVLGM